MGNRTSSINFKDDQALDNLDRAAARNKMNRSAFVRAAVLFYQRHLAANGLISAVAVDRTDEREGVDDG